MFVCYLRELQVSNVFGLISVYPQVFSGFYCLAFARVHILGRKKKLNDAG